MNLHQGPSWPQMLEDSAVLPDFTLTGPLEMVLTEGQPVSLYLPHQADAGLIRCILLDSGAAVTVHGARTVGLRRPVDLPQPSDAVLADIWGRAVRGSVPGAAGSLAGHLDMLLLVNIYIYLGVVLTKTMRHMI